MGKPTPGPHPVVGFGQLLRIALLPSAIADVLVGLSVSHLGTVPVAGAAMLLPLASLGIYHGAMALNDWADRHTDARERPERPIPSGAVPAPLALFTACMLIGGGVLWGAAAGPRAGLWMGGVAVLAVLYDLVGRGAVRGPLLLGLCRAGNLGAGLHAPWLIGQEATLPPLLAVSLMVCYGLHVASLSCLGRMEDGEDQRLAGNFPTACLRSAAVTSGLMALIPATSVILNLGGDRDWLPVATLGALLWFAQANARRLWTAATTFAREGWTRQRAGAATGLVLQRLPYTIAGLAVFTAGLGWFGFAALVFCLAGGLVSKALRKQFPLT